MKQRLPGFFRAFFCLFIINLLVFSAACQTDNSDKQLIDMLMYLQDKKILKGGRGLNPAPFRAKEAGAVLVGPNGKEIGIYIYDTKIKKQRDKLNYVKEHGYIYFNGQKIEACTNGNFMMIGHGKNPNKEKLVEVFESFK